LQLGSLARTRAISRRVQTFLTTHVPTPAGLDAANGTWKLGQEAPDEARRRVHGAGELGWPLSKERGMLEYVG